MVPRKWIASSDKKIIKQVNEIKGRIFYKNLDFSWIVFDIF
jgi:hypothetical protein